jgi:hypothetical protein
MKCVLALIEKEQADGSEVIVCYQVTLTRLVIDQCSSMTLLFLAVCRED